MQCPTCVLKGLLAGLAIILSAWLLVWGAKSILTKSRAESFPPSTLMSTLNKQTGLPEPGTYDLQKIFPAPKLSVLDTKGKLQPLSKYTTGKITLLTFFYQHCSDANGCPYVLTLFHTVKAKLEKNKSSRDAIRFVSISFDPERDTPIMMAGLEKQIQRWDKTKNGMEWDFLTTSSVNELIPLIDEFGQNVDIKIDPDTKEKTLIYQHVLKIFLIDTEGLVREIYSTPFVDAQVLLNDIQTLTLESLAKAR